MKILQIIILFITFLSMVYAATKPVTSEIEKSNSLPVQTRQKRGFLLNKLGLIGGKILATKALLLGTGAGLVGGGIAGAGVYKLTANQRPAGYVGGCGYPIEFMGGCGGARMNPHGGTYGGQVGFEARLYPPVESCDPPCIPRAPVRCCS